MLKQKPIRFREHRGGLDASMRTAREFSSYEALREYLSYLVGSIVAGKAVAERYPKYGDNNDDRIGWTDVHIVSSPGYGVIGFMEGPLVETSVV